MFESGIELISSRFRLERAFQGEDQYMFIAQLRTPGGDWPDTDLILQCYDEDGFLIQDSGGLWAEPSLRADERQYCREIWAESIARAEVVYRPNEGRDPFDEISPSLEIEQEDGEADFDFTTYGSRGDEPRYNANSQEPEREGVSVRSGQGSQDDALRMINRLRERGDERLSKAALADLLERSLLDDTRDSGTIRAVSRSIFFEPKTPYLTTAQTEWTWPRPEWSEWCESVVQILDSVPTHLGRSLMVKATRDELFWAQIAGRAEAFTVAIHDAYSSFHRLQNLEWTPSTFPGTEGLVWHHDYSMAYPIGAVDRLAQGLALGARMVSPEDLVLEPLEIPD